MYFGINAHIPRTKEGWNLFNDIYSKKFRRLEQKSCLCFWWFSDATNSHSYSAIFKVITFVNQMSKKMYAFIMQLQACNLNDWIADVAQFPEETPYDTIVVLKYCVLSINCNIKKVFCNESKRKKKGGKSCKRNCHQNLLHMGACWKFFFGTTQVHLQTSKPIHFEPCISIGEISVAAYRNLQYLLAFSFINVTLY